MSLKIHVLGSSRSIPKEDPKRSEDQRLRMRGAAYAVARALVRQGHTLVLGLSRYSDLVDRSATMMDALEGADSVEKSAFQDRVWGGHRVFIYLPSEVGPHEEGMDVLEKFRRSCKNVVLVERTLGRGPGSSAMISDVREDDAFVLIGGSEGTASLGYAAYALDKPVLPLTGLGGAAADVYHSAIQQEIDALVKHRRVPNEIYHLIASDWKPIEDTTGPEEGRAAATEANRSANEDMAEKIVAGLPHFIHAHTQHLRGSASINIIMLSIIASALLWVNLFVKPFTIDPQVAFFFLLFLSSIMGSGLRLLIAYQQEKLVELSLNELATELIVALVLGFALSLIYLIGGFSFTGKIVLLQSTSPAGQEIVEQSQDFARIALSMSLLGLAAGYLVPIQQLQERLEGFLQTTPETQIQKK